MPGQARQLLEMTDIRTLLQQTARELALGGSPSARLDAEVLLMRFLNIDRPALLMHPERELDAQESDGFARWIARRRSGEPVAYITGQKEFWSLPFEVGPGVLIPRPETECLVEEALTCCGAETGNLRIIDIGTGSGAIAVVLARERPTARVAATDLSPDALAVARRNAQRHGVAGRIDFHEGDLFASTVGSFALIVSNPPYIPEDVYPLLPEGIRAFEPAPALLAGLDGTAVHARIIREGARRLKPGGWLLLEIGEGQAGPVEALFREAGFYDTIRTRADYGGADRVVIARRIEGE
jgi:release factor glutamine methyltransferase